MFPTIDAALGLAFVYLLLSLICSAVREAGEGLVMRRSATLRAGLDRLLGSEAASKLVQHPLLAGLADPSGGPAYIPPRTFSTALLDMVRDDANLPEHLQQALRALGGGSSDTAALQAAIESWFSAAMDAVSRAYRRHTHGCLALIGLGVTVAMNADSIRMTAALFEDSALRSALMETRQRFQAEPFSALDGSQAETALRSLGLPIGWSGQTRDNALPWKAPWTGSWWHNARLLIQWHWAGWLLTVAAISLGAPFWFDLLKRVLPVRPPPT
jgi:hypothetical protein